MQTSRSTAHRGPAPAYPRLHAAGAVVAGHRGRATTAFALALAVLDLNTLARLFDESLRFADVAHGAAQFALFSFLKLLQLAAGFNVFLCFLDKFFKSAFEAAANVFAFVEDAVAVADALNVLDATSEVERRAAVLVFALVNDALDFLLVGGFVDVDVDIGGRLGDEEGVFTCGFFTGADVEEKGVLEGVVCVAFANGCRGA